MSDFTVKDINTYIKHNKDDLLRQETLHKAIEARNAEDYIFTREVEQESTPRIIPHSPLDFVQNLVDKTDIDEILPYEAYYAAHSMRKDLLITPITIPYGNKARQNLDIYSPPNLENNSMPTLVFLYGGGLIHGSKSSNEVGSVFWNNVGTYFAMRGYVTVIPDYRLVNMSLEEDRANSATGNAFYPSGAADIAEVINFMIKNDQDFGFDLAHLFLMAQSAGGIHLGTYLYSDYFYPSLLTSRPNVIVRGAIFISVPFDFENAPESDLTIMKEYYGSSENAACFNPLALRRKAKGALPDQLNILAEKDPDDVICRPHKRFRILFDEKLHVRELAKGNPPDEMIVPQHNHISLILSLGLGGNEDAFATDIVDWMNARIEGWADQQTKEV